MYTNISNISVICIARIVSIVTLVILFTPVQNAFAEVRYEDRSFTQSIVLKRANQPYYFSGQNSIARGVSVTIEKGSEVHIEGNLTVFGKLILAGEDGSHIQVFGNGNQGNPITLIGGELHASHVDIKSISGILDAFATSTVVFDTVQMADITSSVGSSIISIFSNSAITISNSTFNNIHTEYGIEVFNGSSIAIQNSTFTHVGQNTSLLVYGANSTVSISESLFYGNMDSQMDDPQTLNSNTTTLPTQKALEIFSGAYAEISITDFERFSAKAISAFANATLNISKTTFTKNTLGIEAYNSNVQISDSEIFGNIEGGATLYGSGIQAVDNWWGSDTGPKSIALNPNGTGDAYTGDGHISPWKQLKPKKKIKCCSSILFIPGLQGSRIYKSGKALGLPTENQLWEPNTVSDISKLNLNTDGYSIDKTLYVRDIIERTNIAFGGSSDIEIYRGLVKSLDGLQTNYSIEDWQFSAYDWRMSPNTIVTEGSPYSVSKSAIQYKKMEDQIVQMAQISKTKKVTLLAHSYGGLVTKRLLTYLLQRGKIGLIDKVVFVAVPEYGSPSSLFALLHGDNQDIGNGYIVNKATMRKFAQNLPSVYALLPKVNTSMGASFNSPLIFGMQATNTVAVSVPSISTIESMYAFLFKEMPRPSTVDVLETNVPLIANKKIKQKIDIESTSYFVKPQTDQGYEGIEFYNILGVGLNTPESITYVKKPCYGLYTHPSLMSPNCGLGHVPNFSQIGDGVVLANDVLGIGVDGDTSTGNFVRNDRWGEKYIFNIGEYNRKNATNYGHANIVSTPPVISSILQIVMNTIGDYVLPAYMSKHGGIRMGGSGSFAVSSETPVEVLGDSSSNILHKKYQISVSDSVLISARDTQNHIAGVPFSLISPTPIYSSNNQVQKKLSTSQILPVINLVSNSDMSQFGNAYYVHTETLPSELGVIPNPNSEVFTNLSSKDFSIDNSPEFNLAIREITPIVLATSSTSGDSSVPNFSVRTETNLIVSFENIPITEYSTVEVKIDVSSTTQVQMIVTDTYEDVYTNTVQYSANFGETVQGGTGDSVQSNTSGQSAGVGGENVGENVSDADGGTVTEEVNIEHLIGLIRTEIQRSGVRVNFKQRYLLKLNTIERNYNLATESKKLLAKRYSKDTAVSLAAIIKDMQRSRSLYYRGGMRKSEAAFLYSQFLRLSRAFGY